MHAAPAVEVTLDRGARERVLIVLLHLGSAAALATWGLALSEVAEAWPWWMVWLACVLASGAAGLRWAAQVLPASPEDLRWDGRAWALRQQAAGGSREVPLATVIVAIDLGAWVLLQLRPAAGIGRRWRVASAGSVGAAWHGLRLALRAHAGAGRPANDRAAP